MKIEDLKHVEVPIDNGVEGANILVLNTGAIITAEDQAMLMAWHSRDPGDIQHHLAKLATEGSGKAMDTYYVGYGHGSIGDCGNTAVFVGGVSMLVAKALQDFPLYSGQENSTRYIDFSDQPFVNPNGSVAISDIYNDLREFYLGNIADLYPDTKGEGEKWEKAVRARAFDILRGFLPAGASTGVAWNTNLRQARDSLLRLRHHPLEEVREVARALQLGLQEAHPHSFGQKQYDEQEGWTEYVMQEEYLLRHTEDVPLGGVKIDISRLDGKRLLDYRNMLERRPAKSELPPFTTQAGMIEMGFMLDFASFRDIHRHRAVTIRMPEVTSEYGFEDWYIRNLPPSITPKARDLLHSVEERVTALDMPSTLAQYAIPMGYRLPCSVVGGLPGMTYLLDLRSTTPVHPTLRAKVLESGRKLKDRMRANDPPIDLAIHLDQSDAPFDTKRGDHDITKRS